jgi:hypothetical protein
MAWHESFRTSCLNSGGQWHNSTRSIAYALHIMWPLGQNSTNALAIRHGRTQSIGIDRYSCAPICNRRKSAAVWTFVFYCRNRSSVTNYYRYSWSRGRWEYRRSIYALDTIEDE